MSLTITTSYPPKPEVIRPDGEKLLHLTRESELLWVQEQRVRLTVNHAIENLRYCCAKLNISSKCDQRMNVPNLSTTPEKYSLISRTGSPDNLKANVTLLDDNVIQAEVALKHAKAGGGYIRAVAQPAVQWKLQQLQDLGNHIARVSVALCDMKDQVKLMENNKSFSKESGKRMLEEVKMMKNEICLARASIQLPRKRTLLDLCYFQPTKTFVPKLPDDHIFSFYISSCRLVCASYQMVPKTVHPQGLSVFMAECQLPYLDDIIKRLNVVMISLEKLIAYLSSM